MTKRPSLGFGDDDEQDSAPTGKPDLLDLSDFRPSRIARPDRAKIEEAAARTNFKSRESKQSTPPVLLEKPASVRRRRTGRSAQLNLKVRPETIAQFYALADAHGWVLGEAFEKAVQLLEREYGNAK
jgi:hypothetical protein